MKTKPFSRWGLSSILWIFTLIPLLVTVLTELNKTKLVWYIRVVDFVDLVFLAPFYLLIFLIIQKLLFDNKTSLLSMISIGLIGVYMYGHSMHLTGNAINTYSTEIQIYKSIIPADTYALIYFFDEILGHILVFAALFMLLGLWSFVSDDSDRKVYSSAVCGVLFGLSYAVVLIESSQPWFSFVAIVLLIGFSIWKAKVTNQSILYLWEKYTLSRFILSAALAIIVGQLIYLAIFGSFIQPSQIGF